MIPFEREPVVRLVTDMTIDGTGVERVVFDDGVSLRVEEAGLRGFVREYVQKMPHLSSERYAEMLTSGGVRVITPFYVETGRHVDERVYMELLYTREQFDLLFARHIPYDMRDGRRLAHLVPNPPDGVVLYFRYGSF